MVYQCSLTTRAMQLAVTREVTLRDDFSGNPVLHKFSPLWSDMLSRNQGFRRASRVSRSRDMVTVLDAMDDAGFVEQIVVYGKEIQMATQRLLVSRSVEFSDEWTAFHIEGLGAIVFRFKSAADAVSFKLQIIP